MHPATIQFSLAFFAATPVPLLARALVIAVAQRFDFFHLAVDETHAAHELVGAEVVGPGLDGNLDQAIAEVDDTAVKVVMRAAQNRARLDVRWLPAQPTYLRTRITLADQAVECFPNWCPADVQLFRKLDLVDALPRPKIITDRLVAQ